jgi:hypothetical protein
MELKENGIYSLPDGREFVVRVARQGGFLLHDLRLGVSSAPLYLVDGSGQFLSWGRRTRWSVADLHDTGRSSLPVVQRLELL